MHEFLIAIAAAVAVFGLFAAGLALRQRRHPDQAGGGCAHRSGLSRCSGCSSRTGIASPPPAAR